MFARIIIALLLVMSGWVALAQIGVPEQRPMTSRLKVHRINLKDKANARFDWLPHALLTAYRSGQLAGFYPATSDGLMPWWVFADRFGIPAHPLDALSRNDACCKPIGWGLTPQGELTAETLKKIRYPGFEVVLELIETDFTDPSGRRSFQTHFLRLIFFDPAQRRLPQQAVVFRWEDARKVLAQLQVPHPQNEATMQTFGQLVDRRAFSSYPVEVSGRVLVSLEEAKRLDGKATRQDDALRQR